MKEINKDKNVMNYFGILLSDSKQTIDQIYAVFDVSTIPFNLTIANSVESCLLMIESKKADFLIIHHHPQGIDSLRVMEELKLRNFSGNILVIVSPQDAEIANQCIIKGAFVYFINTSQEYQPLFPLLEKIYSLQSQKKESLSLSNNEKLMILDRLSSYISHELKNPLTTINNALYFLKKKSPEDSNHYLSKYITLIENEFNTIDKFLSRLISLAGEKGFLHLALHQINELLQETIHQFPVSHKVKISFQLDPQVPLILIDSEQFQFAVKHLIRNSTQAMPHGGNLIMRTIYADKMVEIQIVDEGEGINKDMLLKIFEPFFTTKSRHIGLGLTFAKIIIQAHSGKIELESVEGQWTKCRIFLPLKKKKNSSPI